MTIPTHLSLEDLSSRYAILRDRQQEIPHLIFKARESISESEAKLEDLEKHQTLLTLGIDANQQLGLDEREAHHISLDIKSLKSSVLKQKSQIDSLHSEDAMLKSLGRELQKAISQKEQQREATVRRKLTEQLDPSVIEEARKAFAELLYFASIQVGAHHSALNLAGVIQTYLQRDGNMLLSNATEALFNTRKKEAIDNLKSKENQQ